MVLNKLILLDFPTGYKLGMDLRQWTIGPNFKGIKEIPDGCHYVYYGPNNEAYNTGFMLYLSSGEMVVKKWSRIKEDFEDIILTEEDFYRYHENQGEIDRYLGRYFMENHIDWWSISDFITPELIRDIMPDCGRIYSIEQFLSKPSSTEDRKNNTPKLDKDGLVELECDPVAKIHFTEIPRILFPEDTSDRTKYMLDKTYTLDKLLASKECFKTNHKVLLGEFQFAFISYNLGFVLAGFDQWMSITDLLCSCIEAITKYQNMYISFISVLHHQIQLTEEDFADIVTKKNKFYISMKRLFGVILEEENVTDELKIKAKGLKEVMMEKYEWNFDEELEDELPIVVDTYTN